MSSAKKFIPFALPDIGNEEIESVVESLRSGWLTTGPKTKLFEEQFAAFVGARHALAVNSATAGLHLSLDAVNIGSGDRVLTTIYTFTATAEVIRYMGADPVFVDIEPLSLNMDVDAALQTARTDASIRALIPVHIGGLSCELQSVLQYCGANEIAVIEDAAHALPATYKGKMIGAHSDLTVFSFYATKPVATGEGGMITTDNAAFANRIRMMRLHGINRDVFDRYTTDRPSWYYEVVAPGFKYNMPDLAASIGIEQLKKAHALQTRRAAIADRYSAAFQDLPIDLPLQGSPDRMHSWHLYIIQLQLEEMTIDRDTFIEKMVGEGIGVSVHYIPLHRQPYWRDTYGLTPNDFPVAERAYHRVVSLPIYTRMGDEDVERVIAAVRKILLGAVK